jgi:hypothetical protein
MECSAALESANSLVIFAFEEEVDLRSRGLLAFKRCANETLEFGALKTGSRELST